MGRGPGGRGRTTGERAATPTNADPRGALLPRALPLVLLLAAGLEVLVLLRAEGHALADAVEYLERARELARGLEPGGERAIRSLGFPALLAPFFLVADVLGLAGARSVVIAAGLLQAALTLLLVRACALLGSSFAGRGGGLVAGLVAATNPVLLRYSSVTIADIAATLAFAEALLRLLPRPDGAPVRPGGPGRSAVFGGLWLGVSVLFAYKALVLAAPLLAVLFVRNVRRPARALLAASVFLAGPLLACALDALVLGRFGASLGLYLAQNLGAVGARLAGELGFLDLARALFAMVARANDALGDYDIASLDMSTVRQRQPVGFYFTEIERLLAAPVVALVALGALAWLARPRWDGAAVLAITATLATLTTFKGTKDFRLWLPLVPCFAAMAAAGWRVLAGAPAGAGGPASPGRRARAVGAGVVVALGAVLGVRTLLETNLRRHAGYARALDGIAAESLAADRPLRTAAAWHWAASLRADPARVDLLKLPYGLDRWARLDEGERTELRAALHGGEPGKAPIERLIVHMPVLSTQPELALRLGEAFVVAQRLDAPEFEELGPVLVLRRRGAEEPRSDWDALIGTETLRGASAGRVGGYRRACEWLRGQPWRAGLRVTSAWPRAVALLTPLDVDAVRLPHEIERWEELGEGPRRELLAALAGTDALVAHLAALDSRPGLFDAVNARFSVAALFRAPDDEGLGPVLVLLARERAPGGATFWSVSALRDRDDYRATRGLDEPLDLIRKLPGGAVERVSLLGVEYAPLPGDGHGWLTFHWTCDEPPAVDSVVRARATLEQERAVWHSDFGHGWDRVPATAWEPGRVLAEGRPCVVLDAGGATGPQEAELWLALVLADGSGLRYYAALPGADQPLHRGLKAGERETANGWRYDEEGFIRVARFVLASREPRGNARGGR